MRKSSSNSSDSSFGLDSIEFPSLKSADLKTIESNQMNKPSFDAEEWADINKLPKPVIAFAPPPASSKTDSSIGGYLRKAIRIESVGHSKAESSDAPTPEASNISKADDFFNPKAGQTSTFPQQMAPAFADRQVNSVVYSVQQVESHNVQKLQTQSENPSELQTSSVKVTSSKPTTDTKPLASNIFFEKKPIPPTYERPATAIQGKIYHELDEEEKGLHPVPPLPKQFPSKEIGETKFNFEISGSPSPKLSEDKPEFKLFEAEPNSRLTIGRNPQPVVKERMQPSLEQFIENPIADAVIRPNQLSPTSKPIFSISKLPQEKSKASDKTELEKTEVLQSFASISQKDALISKGSLSKTEELFDQMASRPNLNAKLNYENSRDFRPYESEAKKTSGFSSFPNDLPSHFLSNFFEDFEDKDERKHSEVFDDPPSIKTSILESTPPSAKDYIAPLAKKLTQPQDIPATDLKPVKSDQSQSFTPMANIQAPKKAFVTELNAELSKSPNLLEMPSTSANSSALSSAVKSGTSFKVEGRVTQTNPSSFQSPSSKSIKQDSLPKGDRPSNPMNIISRRPQSKQTKIEIIDGFEQDELSELHEIKEDKQTFAYIKSPEFSADEIPNPDLPSKKVDGGKTIPRYKPLADESLKTEVNLPKNVDVVVGKGDPTLEMYQVPHVAQKTEFSRISSPKAVPKEQAPFISNPNVKLSPRTSAAPDAVHSDKHAPHRTIEFAELNSSKPPAQQELEKANLATSDEIKVIIRSEASPSNEGEIWDKANADRQIELRQPLVQLASISFEEAYQELLRNVSRDYEQQAQAEIPKKRFICCFSRGVEEIKIAENVSLRTKYLALTKHSLDPRIILHQRIFMTLWQHINNTTSVVPITGPHWQSIGFQNEFPGTDLRATGIMGVLCMLYLVSQTTTYKDQLLNSENSIRSIFALICIRCCHYAITNLRIGTLNKKINQDGNLYYNFFRYFIGLIEVWLTDLKGATLGKTEVEESLKKLHQISFDYRRIYDAAIKVLHIEQSVSSSRNILKRT